MPTCPLQPEPGAGTKDDLVSLVAQHFAEQVRAGWSLSRAIKMRWASPALSSRLFGAGCCSACLLWAALIRSPSLFPAWLQTVDEAQVISHFLRAAKRHSAHGTTWRR